MKRSWIGFGLLMILLVLSLLSTAFLTRVHDQTVLELEQSQQCALLGDWDNTHLFLRRARNRWEKWEHPLACLTDHEPAEKIGASFAVLDIYRQAKDVTSYRAACADLVRQIEALSEAHAPVWWNLL